MYKCKLPQSALVLGYVKSTWKAAVKAIKGALISSYSRSVYRMVLIGETGSGKTSFLNLLFNFDMVCEMGLEKFRSIAQF